MNLPDTTKQTALQAALAEILDGANQLKALSPTNSTSEFNQFCLKVAFDTWVQVTGRQAAFVDPMSGIDWVAEQRKVLAEEAYQTQVQDAARAQLGGQAGVPRGPAHHGYGVDPHYTGGSAG